MRQGRALLLGLLAGLLVGCATGKPVRSSSWLDRFRPFHGETADLIMLEVALIERHPADAFINAELWQVADEQAVSPENKAILEENGFRVGQVSDLTPTRLQALLTSEKSCINPRRLFLHSGGTTTVKLGPTRPHCRFDLHQDGQTQTVSLEQAECSFVILPTLTDDGRTRLHFTPQLRHGETIMAAHPASDHSGLLWQPERPTRTYEALAWDVTLAPNQYVVIGTHFDQTETLASQCFLRQDEEVPVQRLLVIRTCRPSQGLAPEETSALPESGPLAKRSAPLALQATWTSARGCEP
jgi:hypothetical protein